MKCCGHCRDAGNFFNDRTAKREMRRYKRRGPDKPTHLLIQSVQEEGVDGKKLMDIGGGIGAIQLEFFKKGLSQSVNVDASAAYQQLSSEEIQKRGLNNRAEFHFGDFTDMASSLPATDIVTLDKVICCYPDAEKLLNESLAKSSEIYGLVFPRETVIARIVFTLGNLWFRIRKSDFRTFLHSVNRVESVIRSHGFKNISRKKTFFWHVMVFKKS